MKTWRIRKTFLLFMLTLLCFTLIPFTAMAQPELSDDIVILYTNDVHTYIDSALSYDTVAYIKEQLQTQYKHVLLADAGDHVQGTAYGSMDKGNTIIAMMNTAGYDIATLGNHEFDYAMAGCLNNIALAEFPYVSCNFYHEENGVRGENVLNSYKMFTCGDITVAFIGITTPETFSKSTPAYFQNERGEFIYGISGGKDGAALYSDVQKAIDEAKAEGATHIIALGHLGVDPSSVPWTSRETIAAVSGLSAFIDGHSHTTIVNEAVTDKNGAQVLLTQTGQYLSSIGIMVIDAETGAISADLISYNKEDGTLYSNYYNGNASNAHEATKALKDNWLKEIDQRLGEVVGNATVVFDNYDSNGNRLVRSAETNTGDFAADSLYYLFDNMDLDVDIAIVNGGGIRNEAITGNITYKTCKNILPFDNTACLQTVTGQQILDMLEWSARYIGEGENGSFMHVAGARYRINTAVKNTTQADENDVWVGGPEKYRVFDVSIYNKETNTWEPLKLDGTYNLAGYNYNLRDLGGGFAMLDGAVNVLDYVMKDYMVLANYISGFKNNTIEATNSPLLDKYPGLNINYGSINGDGRVKIVERSNLLICLLLLLVSSAMVIVPVYLTHLRRKKARR